METFFVVTSILGFIVCVIWSIINTINCIFKKVKWDFKPIALALLCFTILLITLTSVGNKEFKEKADKNSQPKTTAQDKTTEHSSTITTTNVSMQSLFINEGFTESESKNMVNIFNKVGIYHIKNIRQQLGTGIDTLQAFQADIDDDNGLKVNFTIDTRKLAYIELAGIINQKSPLDLEETGVTLYDKWNDNGTYNENSIGYIAVYQSSNAKVIKYK